MAKVYFISCRDVGVDCSYSARGGSLEEVLEHCAEHARLEHHMRAFGVELFSRMRRHIQVIEDVQVVEEESIEPN